MAYVNSSGQMVDSPGIVKKFKTAWSIVVLFFLTLFGPLSQLISPSSASSSSGTGGSRSGSGGSSSGGGNRRGGFRTMSDIRPPPMPFGGCSGGACGR